MTLPSAALDPKLEAATRLYIYGRKQELRRVYLPTARKWLSDWRRRSSEVAIATGASENDSALIDETLQRLDRGTQLDDKVVRELIVLRGKSDEEIARFARKPQQLECEKQDALNRLVEKSYDSGKRAEQCFRPFAQLLADEEVQRRVSHRVAHELLPIMSPLFVLFEIPESCETWKAEFDRRLISELQRIADEEIVRPASSGHPTTHPRTQQIGDRVVSHLPPRSGTPVQQTDQGGSQINIATLLRTPWKRLIAGIMLDHPDYSNREICDAADRSRNSRDEGVTKKELAPPVSWMKASGETRPPEKWLLDEVLWARVYDNKDSLHALEGEFSKIRKKLGLKKRPAAKKPT